MFWWCTDNRVMFFLYQSSGRNKIAECTSGGSQTAFLCLDQPAYHQCIYQADSIRPWMLFHMAGRLDSTPRSGADDNGRRMGLQQKTCSQTVKFLTAWRTKQDLRVWMHNWPDIFYVFPPLPLIWRTLRQVWLLSAVSNSIFPCKAIVSDCSLTDSRTILSSA